MFADTDIEAEKLKAALEKAQKCLSGTEIEAMAAAAKMPLPPEPDAKHLKHAGMRALLLVFAAAMLQAETGKLRSTTAYDPSEKIKPDLSLQRCIDSENIPSSLISVWNALSDETRSPIYETSVSILTVSLPLSERQSEAVKIVAQQALESHLALAGGSHDLLGRIFHWVLDTSKNDGSYYTSTAAAALLAGLAMQEEDLEDISAFKVLDPACGTGTLLMAAAERIADIKQEYPDIRRHVSEHVLHGWDANISAVRLAAVSVGLAAPDLSFDEINIRHLPVGLDSGGEAKAGSLEMISDQFLQPQLLNISTADTDISNLPAENKYSLVIMNPPFTADAKRYDQLGAEIEQKIRKREKQLFADLPASRTHPGGMFLLLAEKLADTKNGILAFVCPLAGADAPSMRKTWKKIFETFYLEFVVSVFDPQNLAFSENTSISEMLVVLRRRNENMPAKSIQFVRFAVNPRTHAEALDAAESIREVNNSKFSGSIVFWPHERAEQGCWNPVKFFSDKLAYLTWEWFDETNEDMFIVLSEAAEVGPSGNGIRGTFIRSDISDTADSDMMTALWFNDQSDKPASEATKTCMEVVPDSVITAKHGLEDRADRLWQQKACLFIPARIRTTSAATVSVISPQPALGSAWVPVRSKTEPVGCEWEKAICAYLNSTVGVLALLAEASPVVLGRPEMSLDALRRVRVPKLSEIQIGQLADVYGELKNRNLERLRFADSAIRTALDRHVCEIVGLPIKDTDIARCLLAEEPGITGRRHKDAV